MLKLKISKIAFLKIFSVNGYPCLWQKKLKVILLLTLPILAQLSCNTTEPNLETELKLEDISCTEAWLQLTTNNIRLPATVTLLKNNAVSQIFNLSTKDTLLYIDSLLPNQTYKFKAILNTSNNQQPFSNEVLAQTLDTTSHNFTWQTVTFGEMGADGSVLFDVAIINENNIWAVGEIYLNDSLGSPDPIAYNAMHGDGQNWELKRINMQSSCNPVIYPPIRAIWAFSGNDIVITSGGSIGWFDGIMNRTDCNIRPLLTGTINKLWGISSNDLYAVGNSGNIAHYGGPSVGWTKIESGIDADLQDITGIPDGKEIWTCGWSYNNGRVSLLKIKENNVESIWDSQTNTTLNIYRGTLLNSLYANGNKEFVLVGGQVLRHSLINKSKVKLEWIKTFNGSKVLELGNFGYKIKGSDKNNIAVVGDAAMIWHFNGSTWYKYNELYNEEDRLYGLAVTDNLIVAVGKRYSAGSLGGGLLIIGRR